MDNFLKSNQELWNHWTPINYASKMYDVDGFKRGDNRLDSVVRAGLGDVRGKSLLHLQCHFGIDTLNWARLGAQVVGVDFSDEAIRTARALAQDTGIAAEFIQANLYDLPSALTGEFDYVFTSHGVLSWLPDLSAWGKLIARYLKPGGTFFVAEAHPFAYIFDDEHPDDLRVRYRYFPTSLPDKFEVHGSYADITNEFHGVEYAWQHSIAEIISALLDASLQIQELREYPFVAWQMYKFMEQDVDGWWHLPEKYIQLPLMFSLKATKDE